MLTTLLRRVAAAGATAIAGAASVASAASATSAVSAASAAQPAAAADADPEVATALALREVGLRARAVLSDPPSILRRCSRADWRRHAGDDACETLVKCQGALYTALLKAAETWNQTHHVEPAMIGGLQNAAADAEAAVQAARTAAVSGAAAVPWDEAMRGAKFESADGSPANSDDDGPSSLQGRTVALYFTASWCGPCQRFTPKLVQLYEQAGAAGRGSSGFEVVLVSWDELSDDRKSYARQHGMHWLTLPHTSEMRKLADELTLRYDVMAIPTLVVLNVSPDGKEARVLTREGRMDVERGQTPWAGERARL